MVARFLVNRALTFGDLVTDVGTVQKYPLGARREEDGKVYRYVSFDNGSGNVAAAAGSVCYRGIASVTNVDGDQLWKVTSDVSDVDSGFAAGLFISVIADAGFGWILTKGIYATVKKQTGAGNAWLKGDFVVALPSSTSDGKAGRFIIAATTKVSGAEIRRAFERPIGHARAAVSTTTATGRVLIDLE